MRNAFQQGFYLFREEKKRDGDSKIIPNTSHQNVWNKMWVFSVIFLQEYTINTEVRDTVIVQHILLPLQGDQEISFNNAYTTSFSPLSINNISFDAIVVP